MIQIPNTFHIQALARRIVEYTSVGELADILPSLQSEPYMHMGGGSNLLFVGNYEGTLLHSRISGVEVVDEDADSVSVRVGAGMVWDDFVAYTVGRGWSGAENLSLIPGEVGASAVQNIGAYGAEVCNIIESVECIDLRTGEPRTFTRDECQYSYRSSVFKHQYRAMYAVVYVTYRLSKHFTPQLGYGNLASRFIDSAPTLATLRQAIIEIRRAKLPDPEVTGNAGSFFMNPVVSETKFQSLLSQYPSMPFYHVDGGVKIPAGWMIEQCGWKGRELGPAAVHNVSALVLINLGGATGDDILRLCHAVQDDVKCRFGVEIHPEVNIVGN